MTESMPKRQPSTELRHEQELPGIPAQDRHRVLQMTSSLIPLVSEAIKGRHVFAPRRVAPTCLIIAAAAPFANANDVFDAAMIALTIYAIDDVTDGVLGYSDAQVEEVLRAAEAMAYSPASVRRAPLSASTLDLSDASRDITDVIGACFDRLRSHPGKGKFFASLVDRFMLLAESMRREIHWQRSFQTTGSLPGYDEYFANGRESVGIPATMAAFLILLTPAAEAGDLLPSAYASFVDEFTAACSGSVRLLNDVCGFDRELAAGKPNAVTIVMREKGLSLVDAKAVVLRESGALEERVTEMSRSCPVHLRAWADSALRLVACCRGLSPLRETRDISEEMLAD